MNDKKYNMVKKLYMVVLEIEPMCLQGSSKQELLAVFTKKSEAAIYAKDWYAFPYEMRWEYQYRISIIKQRVYDFLEKTKTGIINYRSSGAWIFNKIE